MDELDLKFDERDLEFLEAAMEKFKCKEPGGYLILHSFVLEHLRVGNTIPNEALIALLEANPPNLKDATIMGLNALSEIVRRQFSVDQEGNEREISFKAAVEEWHAKLLTMPREELNELERRIADMDEYSAWEYMRKRKERLT